MISVVIPLYNKEDSIARTLDTVLRQSVSDYEVVVVDDGSTDAGPEVVRGFEDSRVLLVQQDNGGVASARNRGVAESRGDIVAFVDADDEWGREHLATIALLHQQYPASSVYATAYRYVDPDGRERFPVLRRPEGSAGHFEVTDYFALASRSDPPLCASSVAVRREALQEVGGFPVGIHAGEDLLTWARLACRHRVALSMDVHATYHLPYGPGDGVAREPDPADPVGLGLAELVEAHGDRLSSLPAYVALWHRMRADVYLRLRQHQACRAELRKARHYAGRDARLMVFALLSLLPRNGPLSGAATLNRIRRARRP